MATANNLAEYYGGISMSKSYIDIITPQPEEKRTPEQIINNMKEKVNNYGID